MRAMIRSFVVAGPTAAMLILLPAVAQASSAPPALAWSPTTIGATYDYGTVAVGRTVSRIFTLANAGGNASAALKVTLAGSSAFSLTSDTCSATSLGPRKSCTVVVSFAAEQLRAPRWRC